MLKNYIKIAYRNLQRNKIYSLINIFGLSVGICAVLLIILYVQMEMSYDNFHENGDNLYRISVEHFEGNKLGFDSHVFTPPIGVDMKDVFPEVINYTRFSSEREYYITWKNKAIKIDEIKYADGGLFSMFSFDKISSFDDKVLYKPNTILLTRETADKIFGTSDPVGEIVVIENKSFNVAGIIENIPTNSSIQFNVLISFETLKQDKALSLGWDGMNQFTTYLQLQESISLQNLQEKFPDFLWDRINKKHAAYNYELKPYLQPLKRMHLFFNSENDSILTNIIIFVLTGCFILLIACINFVNMTIAASIKRTKEVGVRKSIGANQSAIFKQFIGESLLITFIAFVLAVLFAEFLSPIYSQLVSVKLNLINLLSMGNIFVVLVLILLIGALAGSYPAFVLSSLNVVKILKGSKSGKTKKLTSRDILITTQFIISLVLIIATIVINNQINFIKNKSLGFNKENVLVIPVNSNEIVGQAKLLRDKMLINPEVSSATLSSDIPHNNFTSNGYIPEGSDIPIMINVVDVDDNFLETFELEIVNGRNFSEEFVTDKGKYLINESFVRMMGWENPIGKTVKRNGIHQIIGVVKDFNFASLHSVVRPLIFTSTPWRDKYSYLSLKVKSNNWRETIGSFEEVWSNFSAKPFEYSFLDEKFDTLYKSEERFLSLFFYFSAIAIILALLGLYSLISFSAEQKTKEIGIRKALGASVPNIVATLSKEYLVLVAVGNLIAAPIAYYSLQIWLQNFAYKTELEIYLFVSISIMSLLFSFLVVGYRARKAALANPVASLRNE